MHKLQEHGKAPGLATKFARCIGEDRMPLDRMPFGLIQYQVDFFSADHINEVNNW